MSLSRTTRRVILIAALLGATMAGAAGVVRYRQADNRAFELELAEAKRAIKGGRQASARQQLLKLSERRPSHDEVLYLLGLSEQLMGRDEAAEKALSRVPADSRHGVLAAVALADIELARGQLTEAENRLRTALTLPGVERPVARWDLVKLLRIEGRVDEARRVFEAGLGEHPEPVEALKLLHKLDVDPYPVDSARELFDQAERLAPADSRTRLGRANLALQTGRLEAADTLLSECERQSAADPAVVRARLEWARLADRPDLAARLLPRLQVDPVRDAGFAALLKIWLARAVGDTAAERAALEGLDRIDPDRPDVLDRLATLASEAGRVDEAAALRARRADRETRVDRYEALTLTARPLDQAEELAKLADSLGLTFDAAGWRWLAEERKGPAPGSTAGARATLADLVGSDLVARAGKLGAREARETVLMPRFDRIGDQSGLDFVHRTGHIEGRLALPETGAGGVALFDYDNDGHLDLYAVQGGEFPPQPGAPFGDRLYRNLGNGSFANVTEPSGLAAFPGGFGHGVTAGDIDNDGDVDLFITRWRSYALYRNNGDGTFGDATESLGLGGDRDWPTSAALADLDADGDLDLYVCHYLAWDEHNDRTCIDPNDPSKYQCNPIDFRARQDRLFRNDGTRFVDVSDESGITGADTDGRGLGVVAVDADGDGRLDLFVANDMTANFLFLNRGGMRFEESAHRAGVAANAQGGYQAGMGVAAGDLDGDGRIDLCVTNYYGESTSFFRNLGDGQFADATASIGLAAPSRALLGFGLLLFDANNDGRLDLMSANGHVHDGRPSYPWKMPMQILVMTGLGRLADASAQAGPAFEALHLGRGLASGDMNGDGRVDTVMLAQDEPLVALTNETPRADARWIELALEGRGGSNRDAIGATVRLEAGGRSQLAQRTGGGSFQSASSPRIHFGLGSAERVDRIEVTWPSGQTDRFEGLAVDRSYRIIEGQAEPVPLAPAVSIPPPQ